MSGKSLRQSAYARIAHAKRAVHECLHLHVHAVTDFPYLSQVQLPFKHHSAASGLFEEARTLYVPYGALRGSVKGDGDIRE